MTSPADINLYDELRSIQAYLSTEFPSLEIRISRPKQDEDYDMLIEPPLEIIDDSRGTYMSDVTMPLTIQRWCDSYGEAVTAAEDLRRVFILGVGQGDKRRVPIWKFANYDQPLSHPDTPDITVDAPDRFLKVADLSTKIMQTEKVGEFVVIVDLKLQGWRISWTRAVDTIDTVNINVDFTP